MEDRPLHPFSLVESLQRVARNYMVTLKFVATTQLTYDDEHDFIFLCAIMERLQRTTQHVRALSAPNLLNLYLSGYKFSTMMLSWKQLRRSKAQILTVADFLKVLKRSPSLKECHSERVYSRLFSRDLPIPDATHDIILIKEALTA